MQVGQPFWSFTTPFGHGVKQPIPGQATGSVGAVGSIGAGSGGGTQPVVPPPALPPPPLEPTQLHSQGGQSSPDTQPGQAQVQLLFVPSGELVGVSGARTGAGPASQMVTHSQDVPGSQLGQAVTQVPGSVQPAPPSPQLQAQGGQLSPGRQAGQAQAQAPPEPPGAPPPEQSHSTAGHSVPIGQATGLTQAQSVPSSPRRWQ